MLAIAGAGALTALAGCGATGREAPDASGDPGSDDPGGNAPTRSRATQTVDGQYDCSFAPHAPYAGDLIFPFAFDHPEGWTESLPVGGDGEGLTQVTLGRPSTRAAINSHELVVTANAVRQADQYSLDDLDDSYSRQEPMAYGDEEAQVAYTEEETTDGPDDEGYYEWKLVLPTDEPDVIRPASVIASGTGATSQGSGGIPACLDASRAAGEATVRSIRPL